MTGSSPTRLTRHDRPYERRRRGPLLAIVSALAVLAVTTWAVVLGAGGAASQMSCPSPAGGREPGTVLDADALAAVAPAPVDTIRVRVLNAGGQRGQANLVDAQLEELGFSDAAPPANDPFHPDGEMTCLGQLRFGSAGQAGAATLTLVLPCVELVRDARADPSVDVVVGTEFRDADPPRAVRDLLDELANPAGGVGEEGTDGAETGPSAPSARAPLPAGEYAQIRGAC